ncbi:hypothetical protein [Oryzihumus sp.]
MSSSSVGRRQPSIRWSAGALMAVALVLSQAPGIALGQASLHPGTPGGAVATLTAAKATLAGLAYDGVVTVPTTAGTVSTIELRSTAATLTGLELHTPCTPVTALGTGLTAASVTPADSASTSANGLTLYARSVTATVAGASVTWTPDTPPPAADLGDVVLTDVTIEVTSLKLPAFSAPGLRASASFCTPA